MINQFSTDILFTEAEKKVNAYKIALKEDKHELACNHLIVATKLRIAHAYSVDDNDIINKAIAYREAAKLAFLTGDYARALRLRNRGLSINSEKSINDTISTLNEDSHPPEPLLISILIRKRHEEEREGFKIGDVVLLNKVFCYSHQDQLVSVGLECAICISQAFMHCGAKSHTFYLTSSKVFINESYKFMKMHGVDLSSYFHDFSSLPNIR